MRGEQYNDAGHIWIESATAPQFVDISSCVAGLFLKNKTRQVRGFIAQINKIPCRMQLSQNYISIDIMFILQIKIGHLHETDQNNIYTI